MFGANHTSGLAQSASNHNNAQLQAMAEAKQAAFQGQQAQCSPQPPEQPLMDHLGSNLLRHIDVAGDTLGVLRALHGRLFGSGPEADDLSAGKSGVTVSGHADDLKTLHSSLQVKLYQIQRVASELNGRI